MTSEIDDLLTSIRSLSERIDALPDGHGERPALEERRRELRERARERADAQRHPLSVVAEIAMLESRLREIEDLHIEKGYSEKHLGRTIQDPGAYRHAINQLIDAHHDEEVSAITIRLANLRTLVAKESP